MWVESGAEPPSSSSSSCWLSLPVKGPGAQGCTFVRFLSPRKLPEEQEAAEAPQSTASPTLAGSFVEEAGGSLERVKRCSARPAAAAANPEPFSHTQPPNSLTFSILHEKDKGWKIFP